MEKKPGIFELTVVLLLGAILCGVWSIHATVKETQASLIAEQEVQRKKWCEEELAKNPDWKRPNWW